MSMRKVAELHGRGLISDEVLEHVAMAVFEKAASTTAAAQMLMRDIISKAMPAPTASKLKQILVKSRLGRPHGIARSKSPGADWNTMPGWYGKAKGPKGAANWYEKDVAHGGPRIRATPLGKVVGYGGPAVAGLAGAHAAGEGSEKLRQKRISKKGLKAMLKSNPDVAGMDPDKVQASFKTMTRLAPDLAADPQISGAFVRRTAGQYSELGVDPKMAKDLLDAQGSFLKSKSDRGSFSGALKALGLGATAMST